MAKSATMFMGSHLFQGLATGNFKVDVRGLGTTIAAAALIGSGPNLSAEATFMDNLATQVVHELKAAPTRMAINTTIGGERFEDAAVSTLRQGTSHAISATLAHQIGQFYQGPDKLGYITHKLAHFASGALTGTIMANDPLGGGFGAAFAEVAMEAMVDAEKEAKAIYKENPTLSIPEVEALMKERIMLRRYFSQVIGGFVGTVAGDGNFGVAASISAIALDYNMEPTLTSAATAAYLTQQAPALAAFLTTPPGIAVAASLGIVVLSIDQIKENLQLLGQLYQVYVMVLRGELKIEVNADGKADIFTKEGAKVNQSSFFNTQSSSAAGGMPDPDEHNNQKKKEETKLKDGDTLSEHDALTEAEKFLGENHTQAEKGRYVSADGLRQVRMKDVDILGKHAGGRHMNFDILKPDPLRSGKFIVEKKIHIFLK